MQSRPVGAGIMELIDAPDDSRAQAAALALATIALDLLALAGLRHATPASDIQAGDLV